MSGPGPSSEDPNLKSLYPFLHGERQDPLAMRAALLESVKQKAESHRAVFDDFFARHADQVVAVSESIAAVYQRDGKILCMGNGGSSCDAGHIAVEFLHPVTAGRPALAAVDLTSDRAMLSAVGNDIGFSHVFVRQVIAHGRAGDALIGMSTSGNSKNLVSAFIKAKELGLTTIGFAGMSGGEMQRIGLDHCIVVDTDSIHRIQECHVAIYHIIWDLVHTLLADRRGSCSG